MSRQDRGDLVDALRARRGAGRALLLDGATGTELEARGLRASLPLWSTHALLEAPNEVLAVHRAYCESGAELITANTFRTQRRTLARAGIGERDRELTALAVGLAREATATTETSEACWVLGSAPPLEDCYRPDLVPARVELEAEHRRHASNLAEAEVDAILCETIGTLAETRAALAAAKETGLPCLMSFAATVTGRGAPALLSGEPLAEAVAVANGEGASALLVNCLPADAIGPCLRTLAEGTLPYGGYPNQGEPLPVGGSDEAVPDFDRFEEPAALAMRARGWITRGATLVGGCCGTTPAHLRALADALL